MKAYRTYLYTQRELDMRKNDRYPWEVVRFTRTFGGTVALVLAATVGISGCGSKARTEAKSPVTTSTTSIATSTTLSDRESAAIDGYRKFWTAYFAAADPMNPNDPALSAHATGEELGQVKSGFLARKSAGQVIRGTIDLAPHVVSSTDNEANISDCYFDHSQHFDASTGKPVDAADTERQSITAKMQLVDGKWKVASIHHEGSGCSPAP